MLVRPSRALLDAREKEGRKDTHVADLVRVALSDRLGREEEAGSRQDEDSLSVFPSLFAGLV